jgi:hypothetical protein
VRSELFCTYPRIRNISSGTHNTAPRTKVHQAALGYSATSSEENAHPYRMKAHPSYLETDRYRSNTHQRSDSQSYSLANRTDKRHEGREGRHFEAASLKKEWWNRRPLMDQGNRQQQVRRKADHFLDTWKGEKRRRTEHILVADEAARKRASDPFIGEGDRAKRRRLPDDAVAGQRIFWRRQTEDDRHGPNIYKDTKS